MMRWIERSVLALLLLVLVGTLLDWLTWKFRATRGQGFGAVTVTRVVVAPLKGHREAYYQDGSEQERCSRSVLPWGGARACWYVERQRTVMER